MRPAGRTQNSELSTQHSALSTQHSALTATLTGLTRSVTMSMLRHAGADSGCDLSCDELSCCTLIQHRKQSDVSPRRYLRPAVPAESLKTVPVSQNTHRTGRSKLMEVRPL